MVIYLTDALQSIAGNTALYEGSTLMTMRGIDYIDGTYKEEPETDNRTGDEMADDFIEGLGVSN